LGGGAQFFEEAACFPGGKAVVGYALDQGYLFRPFFHPLGGQAGFLVPLQQGKGLFQAPVLPVQGVKFFERQRVIHNF
jgi:hypothetical protein